MATDSSEKNSSLVVLDGGDDETFCDSVMESFLDVFFDIDANQDEYYSAAVSFLADLAYAGEQLPRPSKRIGDAWFAFAVDQAAKEVAVNNDYIVENEEEIVAASFARRFGASILKEMVVSGWNNCSLCGGGYFVKPSFANEFGIFEEDDSRYAGHLVHRVLQHLPCGFDEIEDENEAEKVLESYPRFVCYTCDINAPRCASIFTYDNQFYIPIKDDAEEAAIALSLATRAVSTRGYEEDEEGGDDKEASNDIGGNFISLGCIR